MVALVLIAWATGLMYYDLRWRRLPNWLMLVGMGVGGLYGVVHGTMPYEVPLSDSLGTAVLALIVFWQGWRLGWMGAGDVKLCTVIGWLGGVKCLLVTLLFGSVIASVMGLVLMKLPNLAGYLSSRDLEPRLRNRIPYGAGLALAFVGWNLAKIYDLVPINV